MKYIEKDAQERAEKRRRNKKKAEELKQKGNTFYKEGKHKVAKDWYTEAINLIPDNAVYYSNRALVKLILETDNILSYICEIRILTCWFRHTLYSSFDKQQLNFDNEL